MTPKELRKLRHTVATEYNDWYKQEVKAGDERPKKETVKANLARLEEFLKKQAEKEEKDRGSERNLEVASDATPVH